jgi:DNA-binding MarR family transcriptional regulator
MSAAPTLDEDLLALDAALGRLRRLWESPRIRQQFHDRLGEVVDPAMARTLWAIDVSECLEPSVRDVAEQLSVDTSTASRLVDTVVSAGLVERATSAQDRRRAVLRLTPEGSELRLRVQRLRTQLLAERTADWDPADVATLAILLDRLARAGPAQGHPRTR